ncbi:hypothetical protein [Actinomadura flavalba]|uniref:hypothetical protein n=1 Tax=Actinomadura flavalba TaxID=1120938 RepID=UPI0012DE597F|nr:hypothetical protein [Actinomadura flavalba]
MTAQMRTGPAARNADFRGIDPPALNHLSRQVQDARVTIIGWLTAHQPPPGVAHTGRRQAEEVVLWIADALSMLERRYNFAITNPDPGGGIEAPPASPPPASGGGAPPGGTKTTPPAVPAPPRGARPGSPPGGSPTTPPGVPVPPRRAQPPELVPVQRGAGDLGAYPTRGDALRAGRSDAAAIRADGPVPASVWANLKASADDPDYTEALYDRLGPHEAAGLLAAAGHDPARVAVIQQSMGMASHHMVMDEKWLRAFLASADAAGAGPVAVQVLAGADFGAKTSAALARIDLRAVRPADLRPAAAPGPTGS